MQPCTTTLICDKDFNAPVNPWDVPFFLRYAKRKAVHAHTHIQT